MIVFLVYCVDHGWPTFLHCIFNDETHARGFLKERYDRYGKADPTPLFIKELWVELDDVRWDTGWSWVRTKVGK